MPLRTENDLLAEDMRKKAYQDLAKEYMDRLRDDPAWFGLNVQGHEYPDPTVMDPPIGHVPGPDLMTIINTMVRSHLEKQQEEFETVEEADDFEMDDEDGDVVSPWEDRFYPVMASDPVAPVVSEETDADASARSAQSQSKAEGRPKPKAKAAKPLSADASSPLEDED